MGESPSPSMYEMAREHPSSKSVICSIQPSKVSVNRRRSSAISCCICLSKIFDPASLTCGHRFCEDCLQNYWNSREKPSFIVCPLCRAHVYNVNFTQRPSSSFDEFRKTFNYLDAISERDDPTPSITCLKISLLIPAIYYILKWLGRPIMQLLTHGIRL